MPEVTVRKRVARRSGSWRYRLNRWFYRNRPQVAVSVAFVIFVLAGIVLASLSANTASRPAEETVVATPG